MAGSASLLWVAAGLIGLATVAPSIDQMAGSPEAEITSDGFSVPRAADGQFYLEAKVGGKPVRFLVDSGIDDVVLAGVDAERIGFAGSGRAELPSLTLGPRHASRVAARVAPKLPVSLIGRSYLTRTAAAEFGRDRLVLR